MRALCIGFLWLFGACSDARPELVDEHASAIDATDLTGMDISDIDTPRTRCIIHTVNTMFGPLCRPIALRYDYTANLPGACSASNVMGCSYMTDDLAYVYISIDGQRRPLQIYVGDPISDVYVHELTHVETFCVTGDADHNHTRLIWADDLKRRFVYAKKLITDAGCYNLD